MNTSIYNTQCVMTHGVPCKTHGCLSHAPWPQHKDALCQFTMYIRKSTCFFCNFRLIPDWNFFRRLPFEKLTPLDNLETQNPPLKPLRVYHNKGGFSSGGLQIRSLRDVSLSDGFTQLRSL